MIRNAFDTAVFNIHQSIASSPGAGNNLSFIPLNNARIEFVGLSLTFTTDANAADRHLRVEISSPSQTFVASCAGLVQTASTQRLYMFAPGLITLTSAVGIYIPVALPPNLFLLENWTFNVIVANIQVGDAITAIKYQCKFWTFEQ